MFVSSRVNKGGPGGFKPKFKPKAPAPAAAATTLATQAEAPTPSNPTDEIPASQDLSANSQESVSLTQSTNADQPLTQQSIIPQSSPQRTPSKRVHFGPDVPDHTEQGSSSSQGVQPSPPAARPLPTPIITRRTPSPQRITSPSRRRSFSSDEEGEGRRVRPKIPPTVAPYKGNAIIIRQPNREPTPEPVSTDLVLYEDNTATLKRSQPDDEEQVEEEVIEVTTEEDLKRLPLVQLMKLKSKVLKESTFTIQRQEEAKLKRRRKKAGKEGTPSEMGTPAPEDEMVKADAVAAAAATSVPAMRGHGPQVQVVNGVITLDTSSLMVSAADAVVHEEMEVVDESLANLYTNSASYGKKTHKTKKWTPQETDKFLQCLQWFGSDFNMILQLFPELTRRHLKLKFDKEERTNRSRIDELLRNPVRAPPEILEEMRENQMRRAEERQRVTEAEIQAALEQTKALEGRAAEVEAAEAATEEALTATAAALLSAQTTEETAVAVVEEATVELTAAAVVPVVETPIQAIPVTVSRASVGVRVGGGMKPKMSFKPNVKKAG